MRSCTLRLCRRKQIAPAGKCVFSETAQKSVAQDQASIRLIRALNSSQASRRCATQPTGRPAVRTAIYRTVVLVPALEMDLRVMSSRPSLRSLAEQATRHLVLKRRLPPPFEQCRVRVSPSSGLRFLVKPMNTVDPMLFALANDFVRPGNVVWDVGANQGLFAFAAAHRVGPRGHVLAIEADTWLVALLRASSLEQPRRSGRVTVIPAAVAQGIALRSFCLARRTRATNYLAEYGTSQTGGAREAQTVITVSLDFLLEQTCAPDFIKIDVEGAELEVLRGGQRLLAAHRPTIACEVSEHNATAVTQLLQGHDYQLFDADAPNGVRSPVERAVWNTLAIPR